MCRYLYLYAQMYIWPCLFCIRDVIYISKFQAVPTYRHGKQWRLLSGFGVCATSFTYVCVQQPVDKMSSMSSLIYQAPTCYTIHHTNFAGHTSSKSRVCVQSRKIRQGLV